MMKKKKVITTAVAAAVLSLIAFSGSKISESLDSQNMAERWQADDLKFSQVSVFYPQSRSPYNEQETESISSYIGEKLKADSFVSKDSKIWTNAYSSVMTEADVNVYDRVTGKYNDAASKINVIGTGGDFFDFHQLQLVSGNYIYDSELRTDRAVLDEQAAWNIFSSADVVGMKFLINKCEFEVAGVVRHEDSNAVDKVYPENPLIYVHYEALEQAGLDDALLCYESVVPNPVSNYARNIMLEYFGINTMTESEDGSDPERSLPVIITENTKRYSFGKLWKGLKNYDSRFTADRSIAFPYWENAARVTDTRLIVMFFVSLVLAAYILIVLIVTAAKLWLNRKWHLKDQIEELTYKYTYKKRITDYISADKIEAGEEKEHRLDQD